jgi:hypothetical protein
MAIKPPESPDSCGRRFGVLDDLEGVQRPEDLLLVPARGGLGIADADDDLVGLLPLVAGSAGVAGVLLQQGPPGLAEAVALPSSGSGRLVGVNRERKRELRSISVGSRRGRRRRVKADPGQVLRSSHWEEARIGSGGDVSSLTTPVV